jgi:hypothetical protein
MRKTLCFLFVAIVPLIQISESHAAAVCGSHNFPEKILAPITCNSKARVVVLEEKHFDPLASRIRGQVEALSSSNELTSLMEGKIYYEGQSEQGSTMLGLDDDLLHGMAEIQLAQSAFSAFQETPKLNDAQLNLMKIVKKTFLEGLFAWRELWGDLDWLPQSLKVADNAKFLSSLKRIKQLEHSHSANFDGVMYTTLDQTQKSPWWNEFTNYKDLQFVAEYLMANGLLHLRVNPRYAFINFETDIPWTVGDVRSIGFAHEVLENYCRAAKRNQNVWIQVGEGHGDELSCYLKTYLPPGTDIVEKRPKDFDEIYRTWIQEFQAKVESELRESLIKINSQARLHVYYRFEENELQVCPTDGSSLQLSLLSGESKLVGEVKRVLKSKKYEVTEQVDGGENGQYFCITFPIDRQ